MQLNASANISQQDQLKLMAVKGTPIRSRVLAVLTDEPQSARQVHESLKEWLNLQQVYNALSDMTREGLIESVSVSDGQNGERVHYELTKGNVTMKTETRSPKKVKTPAKHGSVRAWTRDHLTDKPQPAVVLATKTTKFTCFQISNCLHAMWAKGEVERVEATAGTGRGTRYAYQLPTGKKAAKASPRRKSAPRKKASNEPLLGRVEALQKRMLDFYDELDQLTDELKDYAELVDRIKELK